MRINRLPILLIFALILIPQVYADDAPEPYFISPCNTDTTNLETIIITENIANIDVLDLTGENDIVSATFEYQQEEHKWIYIGFDNDPQQPGIQFNGTGPTNSLGGSLWSTQWILSILGEDYYTLRVTLTDTNGNTGSTELVVYYDPTPPVVLLDYRGNSVQVHGNHSIRTTITGNNIRSLSTSSMGPFPLEIIHDNHGDANQQDLGNNTHLINNYSGPASAANSLWRILPEDLYANPTELAKTLTPILSTDPIYGTATGDITPGLTRYLLSQNLNNYSITYNGATVQSDGKVSTKPTWTPYWEALQRGSSTVLLLSRPGTDEIVATTDDDSLYFTGLSGNQYTGKIGLLQPDGSTIHSCELVPTYDKNGYTAVWFDQNENQIHEQNETWYLLAIWSITDTENENWTLVQQDETPLDGLNNYWNTTQSPDGLYYVKTEATDIRETTSTSYQMFYINNKPPTASQLETPTLSQTGQTTAALRWTPSPDYDFYYYEVLCNDTLHETVYTRAPESTLIKGLNPNSTYNVTLRTYDASGDYAISNMIFETKSTDSGTTEIDTENPLVTIISPSSGLTSTKDIVLEWSVNEPIAQAYYKLGVSPRVEIEGTRITISDLIDGQHTITLTVEDYSGNVGESQVTFTVDANAPYIGQPLWRLEGETELFVNIGVPVSDASEIESVICFVTMGATLQEYPMNLDQGNYRCSFTINEDDLPAVFQITATDQAGNTAVNNNQGNHFTLNTETEGYEKPIYSDFLLGGLVLVSLVTIGVVANFLRKR